MLEPDQRRFRVAFSFPGEHRHRVEAIANLLCNHFTRDQILYDRWHSAEFARPNLDVYLAKLYHDESDLLVTFACRAATTNQGHRINLDQRGGRAAFRGGFRIKDISRAEGQFLRLQASWILVQEIEEICGWLVYCRNRQKHHYQLS